MKNFIQLGKDKIEVSEETAQNLRKQFGEKGLIDVVAERVRVSETGKTSQTHPVRISIIYAGKYGRPEGEFIEAPTAASLPGDTISIDSAIKLRNALSEIIQKHDC